VGRRKSRARLLRVKKAGEKEGLEERWLAPGGYQFREEGGGDIKEWERGKGKEDIREFFENHPKESVKKERER